MKTVAKRWMVYVLVALLVMQGVYPAAYAQSTAQPEAPEATQLEAVEDNTPEEELTGNSHTNGTGNRKRDSVSHQCHPGKRSHQRDRP